MLLLFLNVMYITSVIVVLTVGRYDYRLGTNSEPIQIKDSGIMLIVLNIIRPLSEIII
ncbi:hypothetical protein FB6_4235 [Serratia marcescens]|nr:hypothetical protein SMKC004_25890 [Serratia marcescens]CAB1226032.1 hypothetical protein FB6_4235 [Serratia marcescens]